MTKVSGTINVAGNGLSVSGSYSEAGDGDLGPGPVRDGSR